MVASIKRDTDTAWRVMGGKATAFLIKELSKKKKNCEDLQARLEGIEQAERQLEAAHGVANWALLYVKLVRLKHALPSSSSPEKQELFQRLIGQHETQKRESEQERVQHLIVTLQTLLAVRLKPKQHRDREPPGRMQPGETAPLPMMEKHSRGESRMSFSVAAPGQREGSLGFPRGRRRDRAAKESSFDAEPGTPPAFEASAPLAMPPGAPRPLEASLPRGRTLPPI
eukprot:EG_transcript_24779